MPATSFPFYGTSPLLKGFVNILCRDERLRFPSLRVMPELGQAGQHITERPLFRRHSRMPVFTDVPCMVNDRFGPLRGAVVQVAQRGLAGDKARFCLFRPCLGWKVQRSANRHFHAEGRDGVVRPALPPCLYGTSHDIQAASTLHRLVRRESLQERRRDMVLALTPLSRLSRAWGLKTYPVI